VHNTVGLAWLIAFAFFIFWVFTTGEWKQYIPTTKKMFQVVLYYSYGIFRGESPIRCPSAGMPSTTPSSGSSTCPWPPFCCPCRCSRVFSTGDTTRGTPGGWAGSSLDIIALVHMAGAFAILCFLIVHVYMTTTGHTVTAHVKAMITGWEDVEEGEVQEWEKHGDRQPAASKG
jgi:thiosulfate reductase cytochrome b subunit